MKRLMRIGVIVHTGHGKLGYLAYRGGSSLGRLRDPWPIERWFVSTWNRIACAVLGHDRILDGIIETYDEAGRFPCTACSAWLTPSDRSAGQHGEAAHGFGRSEGGPR